MYNNSDCLFEIWLTSMEKRSFWNRLINQHSINEKKYDFGFFGINCGISNAQWKCELNSAH